MKYGRKSIFGFYSQERTLYLLPMHNLSQKSLVKLEKRLCHILSVIQEPVLH